MNISIETNNPCDVLIIDDNIDDYELCNHLLVDRKSVIDNDRDFQLRYASSGESGLAEIAKQLPQCVLLDYSLPGHDGFEVLQNIRKHYTKLPVVVMTGQGSEKLCVDLLKAGAQDYIVKSDIHGQNLSLSIIKAIDACRTNEISANEAKASLSILVVDDNEDDRELLKRTLNKSIHKHYNCFEAESSAVVMDKIQHCSPDCVLLDYSLPGESGLEVLRRIVVHYPFLPVIFFSGQGSESIAAEAIRNGAFHYLVKAEITSELLDNSIRQGLENKSLEAIVHKKNQQIKRYQEEHQALHGAMENAVEGLSQVDLEGNYIYLNTAYAKACGYTPKELIGKNWMLTIYQEDQEDINDAYQQMLDTGKVVKEIRGVRKDNTIFYKRITLISHYDENGHFISHYCFMNDISERKQAEEAVLKSNMELERFAYVASHDLQEPLRMVKSFTELLQKNYASQLDETAMKYMNYAYGGAVQMQALVQDLLEYARLSKTVDNYEAVDLDQLKTPIMTILQHSIEQAGASVEWQALPTVYANPMRLSSVFQNLISNAIKYRQADVNPIITITVSSSGDKWVFSVVDNGIGMKQAYCERIFEPFKRLHRKEQYPGTGVGLSICRKIIEDLGGRIWAASELGKGSIFHFSLPKMAEKH